MRSTSSAVRASSNVVGILRDQAVDDVDLLEGGRDGSPPLMLDRHVDRPELAAHAARPQAGNVRHERRLPFEQVQPAGVAAGLLTQRVRQVVVAVDDRHAAEQPPRAIEQRVALRPQRPAGG